MVKRKAKRQGQIHHGPTGYRKDEKVFDTNDGVSHAYLGKDYEGQQASEVVTMCLQSLLCEDMESFKHYMEQAVRFPDEVAFAAGLLMEIQEGTIGPKRKEAA